MTDFGLRRSCYMKARTRGRTIVLLCVIPVLCAISLPLLWYFFEQRSQCGSWFSFGVLTLLGLVIYRAILSCIYTIFETLCTKCILKSCYRTELRSKTYKHE